VNAAKAADMILQYRAAHCNGGSAGKPPRGTFRADARLPRLI